MIYSGYELNDISDTLRELQSLMIGFTILITVQLSDLLIKHIALFL